MASIRLILFDFASEHFLVFNEKYLYYVGLWPNENSSNTRKILYNIYEIVLHILSLTYLIITGIGTYEIKYDLTLLMSNLDKTLVSYNFVFKAAFFIRKRNELRILINEIKNSCDSVTDERKRFMGVHIILITAFSTSIVSAFCLLSIFRGETVVVAWVPFDAFKNTNNLLLANQIIAGTFIPTMYRAFAIQGIVSTIIMYFCDQLDELQGRLRNLEYTVENEITMRERFKEIIKKHVRIMRYSMKLSSIFKEFFLVQNLAVTIELCLNALMANVVGFDQKILSATFLAYLSMALLNAYIFCYLGDTLISKSQGIALAAYESSWTSWPGDLQKDLLIVIQAAQKPFQLSAGGISVMCIQTYSQALYNAYSIFAVLNDLVE